MEAKVYREYRLKFYLNARHYIIIGKQRGETHPHTWEFALTILINQKEFVQFNIFEQKINEFLSQYQDRILNEVEPFNSVLPTLENMVDHFTRQMYPMIQSVGGQLVYVEGSEGPSRSYILDLRREDDTLEILEDEQDQFLSDVIDNVIDELFD